MTETTTPDETDDDLSISLDATLREYNAGERVLRHLMFGGDPMILIEVDMENSSEEEMKLKVDATGFEPESLAAMLRTVADCFEQDHTKNALNQHTNNK
ncbi:hypothetical protein SEA_BRUHMOMENT_63 [Arthrobacter phage BruhMoment]|nr:hypothetical protein SEA_BRUHMOMENT_63 [Arthrobacter phage BruhMoment]